MDQISDCMLASETKTTIRSDVKVFYHSQRTSYRYTSFKLTVFNGEINIIQTLKSLLGSEALNPDWKLYCWNPCLGSFMYIGLLKKINSYNIPVIWLTIKASEPELLLKIREHKEPELASIQEIEKVKDKKATDMIRNDSIKLILPENQTPMLTRPFITTTDDNKELPVIENTQKNDFLRSMNKIFLVPKKRNKGRTIREVFNLLEKWRELSGKNKKHGMGEKFTLDVAAIKLDSTLKSLWDYTLIIQRGARYGFDFEENMGFSFGRLRDFVKSCQAKDRMRREKKKN